MFDLPSTVRLDQPTIEAIAERVAEMIGAHQRETEGRDRLLTAAEVATWWGVDRTWVYEHARELGVIPLGAGPTPRLRFDPVKLRAYLDRSSKTPEPAPIRPAQRRRVPAYGPGRILQSRPRGTGKAGA
jgi:hypothetical protein